MKARASRSASAVTLQVLTSGQQAAAHRFAVGARGAAAEILDVKAGHLSKCTACHLYVAPGLADAVGQL
jgi:hypothetical protein